MFSVSADGSTDVMVARRMPSAEEAYKVAEEYRCKRLHHVIVKDDTGRVLTEAALSGMVAAERHSEMQLTLAH